MEVWGDIGKGYEGDMKWRGREKGSANKRIKARVFWLLVEMVGWISKGLTMVEMSRLIAPLIHRQLVQEF